MKKIAQPATREKESYIFADGAMFKHPLSWAVREKQGYVTVGGPEPGLYVHVIDSPRVKMASDEAVRQWRNIKPTFSYPIFLAQVMPSERGFERIDSVVFNVPSEESRAIMALALSYKDKTYWLLIEATNELLSRRSAELMLIVQSFRAPGMAKDIKLSSTPKIWGEHEKKLFHNFINDALHELKVPGAAILIVDKCGKRIFHDALGVKDITKKTPITLDTPFLIGSTTKALTTLMMAKLVDNKVITWETKLKDVLKEFAVNDDELTRAIDMRNSVSASTGMPRRDYEFIFVYHGITARERLNELHFMAPTTKMGETFQYSNHLVMAGGYAAAKAYRKNLGLEQGYARAMTDMVFKPLGMRRTVITFDEAKRFGHAQPHALDLDGNIKKIPLERERAVLSVAPAGGLWSTVEDLAHYVTLELNNGMFHNRRVINEIPLLERRKPGAKMGESFNYGLGLFIETNKGLTLIGHDGNTLGFSSLLVFIPEAGLGLIILTNGGVTNAFLHATKQKFLELTFDAPKKSDEELNFAFNAQKAWRAEINSHIKTDKESMAWIKRWQGNFHNETLGTVTIRQKRNGKWMLDCGEWQSDVATLIESNGKHNIILITPPYFFTFQPHENSDSLILDANQQKYQFERWPSKKKGG